MKKKKHVCGAASRLFPLKMEKLIGYLYRIKIKEEEINKNIPITMFIINIFLIYKIIRLSDRPTSETMKIFMKRAMVLISANLCIIRLI